MADPIRAALEQLVETIEGIELEGLPEVDDAIAAARAALAEPELEGPTDDQLIEEAIAVRLAFQPQDEVEEVYLPFDAEEPLNDVLVDFARAVLARWGRPAPPAAGEVAVLSDAELESVARVAEIQNMKEQGGLTASDANGVQVQLQCQRLAGLRAVEAATITRTAALLEQQQRRIAELEAEQMRLKPVPVSERLPGPEDCFIVKNQQWEMRYCWLAKSILHAGEERLVWDWRALPIKISLLVLDDEHWTHWLPANAKLLPVHALLIPQREES